jgi:hypothetical protein
LLESLIESGGATKAFEEVFLGGATDYIGDDERPYFGSGGRIRLGISLV